METIGCPGTTCRDRVTLTLLEIFKCFFTHKREQLCKVILKSIHKYESIGPGRPTNARTYTEVTKRQLCLGHRKQARQKSSRKFNGCDI